MTHNCCHRCFAFNLKFLNFFQFFIGISTVIYSAYLLNQWQNLAPIVPSPPPIAPAPPLPAPPPSFPFPLYGDVGLVEVGERIDRFDVVGLVSGSDSDSDLFSQLYSIQLPTPWFIYALMVVGILLCIMSCIGHIAAEAINGCCLCFYILLELLVILLEAALVTFIAVDRKWEKDLPFDQTGELENLKSFIEKYSDICQWLGIMLLIVQALSVLLSLVLRAMISTRPNSDIENDEYGANEDRIREPLLHSQSIQSPLSPYSPKNDSRETFSDVWATRMRQKYGLKNESSSSTGS